MMEPHNLWWDVLGEKFGERTPRLLDEYQGNKGRFFYTGFQVTRLGEMEAEEDARVTRRMREAGYVPEARVAYHEEEGVDAEVLIPTWFLMIMQNKERDVVRACSQVYNDWLAEFCSYSPNRLIGNAVVPTDDVGWSIHELKRASKKGLKGALSTSTYMRALHPIVTPSTIPSGRWRRTWRSQSRSTYLPAGLQALSTFHTPEEIAEAPRALMLVLTEIMGVLANEFIYGGVLDRFPRLKLSCSEFEISWIPWFLFHIDDTLMAVANRLGLPKPEMQPSEYMKKRISHGFIDDPYALDAIPHIGADQVLWRLPSPRVHRTGAPRVRCQNGRQPPSGGPGLRSLPTTPPEYGGFSPARSTC